MSRLRKRLTSKGFSSCKPVAVLMRKQIFWDVGPCARVIASRRFEGTYRYHLHDFFGLHSYPRFMVTIELGLCVTSQLLVWVSWKQNGSLSTIGSQNTLSYDCAWFARDVRIWSLWLMCLKRFGGVAFVHYDGQSCDASLVSLSIRSQ